MIKIDGLKGNNITQIQKETAVMANDLNTNFKELRTAQTDIDILEQDQYYNNFAKTLTKDFTVLSDNIFVCYDYLEIELGRALEIESGGTLFINDINQNSVPSGSITQFAGSNAPAGWVICDGSALNRTTFISLFSVIGTIYGAGDGTTTFNIPDLRGIFVKGAGTTNRAAGVDANGNYYSGILGTYAQDQMQGHWHQDHTNVSTTFGNPGGGGWSGVVQTAQQGNPSNANNGSGAVTLAPDTVNGTPRSGTITQPQHIVLNYIIKL